MVTGNSKWSTTENAHLSRSTSADHLSQGHPDSHIKKWCCFSCVSKCDHKDHRSFKCPCDFLDHLSGVHGVITWRQSKLSYKELGRITGEDYSW